MELPTSFIKKLSGVCGDSNGCRNPVPGARAQGFLDSTFFSSSAQSTFTQTYDSVTRMNLLLEYLLLFLILFNYYLNTLD